MMKNRKETRIKSAKNGGITLIALIVTIIVLIILAGVAIAMLRGDNGIINRATEVRTANGVSQFDEAIKLAFMSARTKIDAKKNTEPGYIATTESHTQEIATEVAKELGTTAKKAPQAAGAKIETEGYTVAYYLDVQGDAKTDGKTYVVIWYTNNSLRSTMNRADAISKYGLTDVATNKSVNQSVLVSAIQINNYNAELSNKGLTSTTDGDDDLTKAKFGKDSANGDAETSLNGELGFSSVAQDSSGSGGSGAGGGGTGTGSARASLTPAPTAANGKYTAGDEVSIETEKFFVISDDGTNVKLLAKYCLSKTENKQVTSDSVWSNYGRRFSSTNYWSSETIPTYSISNEKVLELQGTYLENHPLSETETEANNAIKKAQAYGTLLGVEGRLMTYAEAYVIQTTGTEKMKKILYGTWTSTEATDPPTSGGFNWWLGAARYSANPWFVNRGGSLSSGNFDDTDLGVRPVLEIK